LPAGRHEAALQVAIGRVAHLVALERCARPRQRKAEREADQQGPQAGAPRIAHARAGHPEADTAPDRARQPVAARAIDRELGEQIEEETERDAGEGLQPLRFEAGKKIEQIDRGQDCEREQEPDEQLFRGSDVFRRIAVHRRVRPQMPPHAGREPEAVEPECHELEQRAARHQAPEIAAPSRKADAGRYAAGGRRSRPQLEWIGKWVGNRIVHECRPEIPNRRPWWRRR
jgi:hypothetical protein